ncbi:MAG TPA: hypothetical protein VGO96_08835 [Pyrinomonadaceae bacterium]|nr:hypothetical protein [Pyrinomonadaceae bacterium]
MYGKRKKDAVADAELERLGRALVRASATNEAEAEAVASSPFLYTRLRARIGEEQARRAGAETWRTLLGVVWRSVPAMALVALFAFILFWTSNFSSAGGATLSPGVLSDEALMDARDAGIENVVFAERRALSSDDVLATLIQQDEREVSR